MVFNKLQSTTKANLILLLVTALWGATFPFIRNAVAYVDPTLFVGIRFLLAALLMLPLVITALKNTNKRLLLHVLLLGIINSCGYLAQTIGLQTVHSARAAFVNGFSVILIPWLTPLFKLGRLSALDIFCSSICLVGIYVLTGADLHGINIGDIWVFVGAILFAISIAYLQHVALAFKNYQAISFYLILFTVPLPLLLSLHTHITPLFHINALIGLLFCAIFATTIAFFLQTKYQPYTTAAKAALIYSLEPVFAAIFAFLINNEPITGPLAIGGAIILFSLMLPALWMLFRSR